MGADQNHAAAPGDRLFQQLGVDEWAAERDLRHGEVLFKLGDRDGARREFEAVAAAGGETSQRARSWLEGMR